METVLSSVFISQLVRFGYSIKTVQSNSVAVLLPLDNEQERELVIHILLKLCEEHSSDGPFALSFGAQSLYEERNGEIIFQPVRWDICNVDHPPFQLTLKDYDASAVSKRRCTASTKRGKNCKRMTFYESALSWDRCDDAYDCCCVVYFYIVELTETSDQNCK